MAEPTKDAPAKNQIVDARTGEVILIKDQTDFQPPDPRTVSDVNKVVGKNPPKANLRDHPEYSGMEITIMDVRFTGGDIGGKKTTFMVAPAYITVPGRKATQEDFRMLITGSDNVIGRVAAAFAKGALPIKGTLRLSGRAWFLD